jgi:L-fucose isomerase-like protein
VKMTNNTIVTALPIGEIDTDLIQAEFDAIIGAFNRLGADLVIADPVSDEAGARRSVQELSDRNADLLLIIPLRGLSAQAMETAARTSQAPCVIWPVQGRFALPSSTLAVGALRESGAPVELLYAPPDHPAAIERIRCVARAAQAYSRIRQSRIGVIGGLFPNLVSCRYDPQVVSSRLGITLLPISFEELRDRIQGTSQRLYEIEQSRQEITSSYAVNAADVKSLEAGIKLHLALKQVAREQKIDGFAAECWTGFPRELGLNPCLGFIDDAYTLACEGDVMACVSLLIVRYLTGTRATIGDLYDLDLDGGLTLVHCGAPASLASNKREVVLAKSQLAMEQGFETMTCRPRLEPGLVTLFRFYGQDCDKMHVALGGLSSCDLSSNLTVKLTVTGNRWDFLGQCFGNHYVVVAGDIRPELKLLSKWLGITIFDT